MLSNYSTLRVAETAYLNLTVQIPPFSNARLKVKFYCIDVTSNSRFAQVMSARILSAGRNVDGFMTDYASGNKLKPIFSTNATGGVFYVDTVVFDLGIITNTRK